jgi:hypothetical protein
LTKPPDGGAKPAPRHVVSTVEDDEDDDAVDLRDESRMQRRNRAAQGHAQRAPAQRRTGRATGLPGATARLPRARLEELLERYRDCLDQAASLYQGECTP